jgi:hypothetical protein
VGQRSAPSNRGIKQPAHIVAETLPAKLVGLLTQRTADFQLIIDNDGSLDDDAIVIPSRWEAFGIISHEAVAEQRLTIAASVDGWLTSHRNMRFK